MRFENLKLIYLQIIDYDKNQFTKSNIKSIIIDIDNSGINLEDILDSS